MWAPSCGGRSSSATCSRRSRCSGTSSSATAPSRAPVGSWGTVLREGVVAGLVGAAIVALWFLAIDTIQGEPLRTPRSSAPRSSRQTDPVAAPCSPTRSCTASRSALRRRRRAAGRGRRATARLRVLPRHPLHGLRGVFVRRHPHRGEVGAGRGRRLDDLRRQPARDRRDARLLLPGHRGLARRLTAAWAEED